MDPQQDRADQEHEYELQLHDAVYDMSKRLSEDLKEFKRMDPDEANNIFLDFCKSYLKEPEKKISQKKIDNDLDLPF